MKLRIASDFHLEFYTYKSHIGSPSRDINEYVCLPRMDGEDQQTLLLAGDILLAADISDYTQMSGMELFFSSIAERFKQVYIVPGNHEYYKGNMWNVDRILKQYYSKWENMRMLQNEYVDLGDDTFLFGATLWTNFDNDVDKMNYARLAMSDFAGAITHGSIDQHIKPRFSPETSVEYHKESLYLIKEFMKKYENSKKIIMTHHSPSFKSVAPKYKGSLLNSAFSSDLDHVIAEYQPDLWIHGHHHSNSDYMIDKTRVVCNPYGYYSENTKDYNPKLIMEI